MHENDILGAYGGLGRKERKRNDDGTSGHVSANEDSGWYFPILSMASVQQQPPKCGEQPIWNICKGDSHMEMDWIGHGKCAEGGVVAQDLQPTAFE